MKIPQQLRGLGLLKVTNFPLEMPIFSNVPNLAKVPEQNDIIFLWCYRNLRTIWMRGVFTKTEDEKIKFTNYTLKIWKSQGQYSNIFKNHWMKSGLCCHRLSFVIGGSKKNNNYIFLNVLTNKAINFGIPSNSFFEFLWNLLKKKIFQVLFWVLPN